MRRVVKSYDDYTCCQLYSQFISTFYDNKYNIFSYEGNNSLLCPYDTTILRKIRDNMFILPSISKQNREEECRDIYKMMETSVPINMTKHYGLLLLLLSYYKFNSYKSAYGFGSNTYFSAIHKLVEKFKARNIACYTKYNFDYAPESLNILNSVIFQHGNPSISF